MKKIMKLNILTLEKCMLVRLYNDVLLKQMFLKNKVPSSKSDNSNIRFCIF
jgi:hypothetical protein